jgi:hypothetical protein
MYTGVHRFLTFELLVNPPSSGTLAFSLRLAPFLPASDSSALHTGSSASPYPIPNFLGPPSQPFLLTASSDTLASSLRLMPPPLAMGVLSHQCWSLVIVRNERGRPVGDAVLHHGLPRSRGSPVYRRGHGEGVFACASTLVRRGEYRAQTGIWRFARFCF